MSRDADTPRATAGQANAGQANAGQDDASTAATVDELHMRRCLELARRGEGMTSPNPMVGCVIVDAGGRVMAEGFHRGLGSLHAEADALAKLGGRADGCTLYCNLEPCNHKRNRRTRPCAPQLASAGIARLVMGMGDPIRGHAGGARFLAKQGIHVTRDVLRAECVELNRGFVTWARYQRPFMVLKAAMSLDGKIATRTGESQWITGAAARRHGHRMRSRLDAIMVGIGTVLADDPRLTARAGRKRRDPIRIIVDSRLRTPADARLLPDNSDSRARVIIATTERADDAQARRLAAAGAEIRRLPCDADDRVDLDHLARELALAGITSVLVEGGAALHGALLDHDLADELMLYIAPMVLGGDSPSWAGGRGVAELSQARGFRVVEPIEMLGHDVLCRLRRSRARARTA